MNGKYVIAAVGAGGKTTWLHEMAAKYLAEGKQVFLTTTTHMKQESDTVVFSGEESEGKMMAVLCDVIREKGYCMAGIRAACEKIKGMPETVLRQVSEFADITLIEADGAKGKWIKFPSMYEPVIPSFVNHIEIMVNMRALGRTLTEAAFRLQEIHDALGYDEDEILTTERMVQIIKLGYVIPLKEQFPHATIRIHPVCADDEEKREAAKKLQNLL